MKKIVFFLNLLWMAVLFAGNYFYHTVGGLILKMLCSSLFFLQGLMNAYFAARVEKKLSPAPFFMCLGLFTTLAGDYLLNEDFLIGACAFALGHVFYCVSYARLSPFRKKDLLPALLLFAGAGAFLCFSPDLSFSEENQRWICLGYALIISLMAGKALGNLCGKHTLPKWLQAFGSLLFFFSDLMLALNWFTPLGKWTGALCMAAYYPAQSLLALSIFFMTANKEEFSHACDHRAL